jgi:3-deoxy-7-phosphoheptulonate synthase
MQSNATDEQVRSVCDKIESLGLKAHPIPGAGRTAIGITGNNGAVDLGILESLPGVVECIPVTKPYKLVSLEVKSDPTIVRIPTPSGDVLVGGEHLAMTAGPCAVETEEQCLAIAAQLKPTGVRLFRGGAYKPRTSPYSFGTGPRPKDSRKVHALTLALSRSHHKRSLDLWKGGLT